MFFKNLCVFDTTIIQRLLNSFSVNSINSYDNGCQLHKFCSARANVEESRFLADKIFVVDRLHIQGHVESCRDEYHPQLYHELNNCNTMICEQRNFWLSSFKYITKHMNQYRFFFFFFVIFSYYNEIKLAGVINIINENWPKCSNNKRKFAFLYSDSESEPEIGTKK